jgi:hypothetical protein
MAGAYQPIADNISLALSLRLEVDDSLVYSPTALIAFRRLDTGEKLLLPIKWQNRAIGAEQAAMVAKQDAAITVAKNLELAEKLAAYEARFGEIS